MQCFLKDGQCPENCGKCCTTILPASKQEIKTIHNYIINNDIKPNNRHNILSSNYVDTCPFLDNNGRCSIYSVRPEVCSWYTCGSKDLAGFDHSDKTMINMYSEFFPHEYTGTKPDLDKINLIYSVSKKAAHITDSAKSKKSNSASTSSISTTSSLTDKATSQEAKEAIANNAGVQLIAAAEGAKVSMMSEGLTKDNLPEGSIIDPKIKVVKAETPAKAKKSTTKKKSE